MPPKKGKKKQVEDDWEAELGETLQVPAPNTEESVDLDDGGDDDDGGGGLMSQLGKSKKVRVMRSYDSFGSDCAGQKGQKEEEAGR